LQEYRLRILTHHDDYPTVSDLLDPTRRDLNMIYEGMARWAEHFKGRLPIFEAAYLPGIHALSKQERHAIESPLLHKTAARLSELGVRLPETFKIEWLQSGKPVIAGMEDTQAGISLSHDERGL
jgi:enediyne polyketide synthase